MGFIKNFGPLVIGSAFERIKTMIEAQAFFSLIKVPWQTYFPSLVCFETELVIKITTIANNVDVEFLAILEYTVYRYTLKYSHWSRQPRVFS